MLHVFGIQVAGWLVGWLAISESRVAGESGLNRGLMSPPERTEALRDRYRAVSLEQG